MGVADIQYKYLIIWVVCHLMTLMTNMLLFMQINKEIGVYGKTYLLALSFTVATVDNFDMLQSHAAIQYKAKERIFHGTTIQFVQPITTLSIITPSNTNNNSNVTDISIDTESNATSYNSSATFQDPENIACNERRRFLLLVPPTN